MNSQLNNVLDAMEQIVLEVIDTNTGKVKLVEGNTEWAKELFPHSDDQQPFFIDDEVPFLHDFLIDARLIWNRQENGRLRSGFWTEITKNNSELHLEAIAIRQKQFNLLVIGNPHEEFQYHQNTKQLARDLLISNDRLYLQNEYLHARLLSILKKPNESGKILSALTKVIENAEFCILIADKNFNTIIENSAALNLFEQNKAHVTSPSKPIDIIRELMISQLPEYERIISTKATWDGELCWMTPPSTLKWLKISLYPVKNKLNEVENWIVFANDISTIKHLTQRNEQLALEDMLTELPNRVAFCQALDTKIKLNKPFYLLYVNINEFRQHNEFYGHDEGDRLLKEFSKRIKNVINSFDFIARVSGDEFAIILTSAHSHLDCKPIINNIISKIKKPFQTNNAENFNVNISIGAVSFPDDAQSIDELMKLADLSMYNCKKSRQSSLQFYSASMKDASLHLIEVERELRLAIKNEEFELFLQPIIDLQSNIITKAEALIRWNHPQKGIINPDQFIPIAEKTELINIIGEWVINETCKISKQINDLGLQIKISMNLSPSQVNDKELFSYILSCIHKYNVDPSLLEIEVTEGVLVDDYSVATKLLSKIRTIGMTVSVDDFGTGYSSLAYLKKLPLDFLKIDRSFIKDIVVDNNDKAIVKAVIAMAHSLNLCVICEGVEMQAQLNFLINNSCNSAQGFLFSRPVKFNAFIDLLNEQNRNI